MIIYLALNNLIVLFNKVVRRWIEEAEKEVKTRLSSQLCTKAITTEFPAMLSFVLVTKQMQKSWLVKYSSEPLSPWIHIKNEECQCKRGYSG